MVLVIPEKVLAETGLNPRFLLAEIKINDVLNQWSVLCAEQGFDYAMFGGTAINKAYLDQPRFSEDVDFFVYGESVERVGRLIRDVKGFKVRAPQRIFREMYRWRLDYAVEGQYDFSGEVQLDVNLNFKVKKTLSEKRFLNSFLSAYGFVLSAPRLNVMPLVALVAQKLLAVKNRAEGKDYYDLYRVLSGNSFSKSRVFEEAFNYSDSLFDFTRFDENLIENAVKSIQSADVKSLSACDAYILKQFRPADWKALKKDLIRLIKIKIQ
jgi:predicted nucleotidyltransferase component of viral defense system